jgi:hypothetical protein
MTGYLVLACVTLFVIFIMFLVISRTMNNIVNQLVKLEYLVQKEYDLKKEAIEVKRIMEDQAREQEERIKAAQEFETK